MKRKIELPNMDSLLSTYKMSDGDLFVQVMEHSDKCREFFLNALQEAYNQGYEDARPRWISVEDSCPDIPEDWYFSKAVNVRWVSESGDYSPQGFESACYSVNGWQFGNGSMDYHEPRRVTHWMPIPDFEKE